MPKSSRYSMTELPGTLQRSCREAQETFLSALDDAVRTHGAGDQAHRIAYLALKQKFEKRGDHWIAKDNPADCGGRGPPVNVLPARRAAASRSSVRQRDPNASPRVPPGGTTPAGSEVRYQNHPVPGFARVIATEEMGQVEMIATMMSSSGLEVTD
jgi:ChaB